MRHGGLGSSGAIPETEIAAWFENTGIDDQEERERLHSYIALLDATFLIWRQQKAKD